MNYEARRSKVYEQMEDNSLLILYSGVPLHVSADEYHWFEADRHFFYLTGLRRENMALVMMKKGEVRRTALYIEEVDPSMERWTGKMVTDEEAQEITGISIVRHVGDLDRDVHFQLSLGLTSCYFNCYRHQKDDLPDYNLVKATEFRKAHPAVQIRDLWPIVTKLRMEKDEEEVAVLRRAVAVTDEALRNVMKHLKPGRREYQAQADFEYAVLSQGAEGTSFPTIAGSGKNGTMLHYETNRDVCEDGTLLLMDLGAKVDGYCADITRTYPVNGRYSDRQRRVYEIVLRANRAVAAAAAPGKTTRQLNDLCKQVLAEGCMELGLIENEKQIGRYYMHGVSHHLGIDVHDVTLPETVLTPGCVITDEPGLYIDEWEIGIRIEDDLLITEEGCVVLSEAIPREMDEIEAIMAADR